jgi:hypothetical protein
MYVCVRPSVCVRAHVLRSESLTICQKTRLINWENGILYSIVLYRYTYRPIVTEFVLKYTGIYAVG